MSEYKPKLGFDDYEKKLLAEAGYTPESARAYVVAKLKKANLYREKLDAFQKPIDELAYGQTEVILDLVLYYKDEPEKWVAKNGDFSTPFGYSTFYMYLDY